VCKGREASTRNVWSSAHEKLLANDSAQPYLQLFIFNTFTADTDMSLLFDGIALLLWLDRFLALNRVFKTIMDNNAQAQNRFFDIQP
jgi:hypothetical protein